MSELEAPRTTALAAAQTRGTAQSRSTTTGHAVRDQPIAFVYARVSTKEQARTGGGADGYSIPVQRDAGLAKAAQLGATVHHVYIDAGESARSTDRDDLQKMLADVKAIKPDYVIVHKIDRLARNREDDIAINLLLRRSGAKLVSCTENIDDTPSGRLLYGLLAEIAEFYSRNLAQEVMKGLLRKAEEGGTPFRAPLGYLNTRENISGVQVASVVLDPDRAELVRWCFEQYATGEWNAADLVLEAQAKGLTSKPGPSTPAGEVGLTTMYSMLKNPYYMGIVSYQGIHYEGKHEPLVEPEVWLAVQDQLIARTQTGDRDRKHSHYLRSTIYCSDCHGRLVFSQSAGNGGLYSYYHCAKKRTRSNNCRRPGVRVERIEQGIADFYRRFELKAEHVQLIQTGVRNEFATQQAEAQAGAARAEKRQAQLNDERQKLMQAHYAGHVPGDLLGTEMNRLTRALTEAEVELKAARATTTEVEATLSAALVAASHCHRAYLTAEHNIRRQINQGFFAKLFIGHDGSVEQVELNERFATLMSPAPACAAASRQAATVPAQIAGDETDGLAAHHATAATSRVVIGAFGEYRDAHHIATERENSATDRDAVLIANGVHKDSLVGAAGFEPATARV